MTEALRIAPGTPDGSTPHASTSRLADIPRVPKEYWKSTLLERRRSGLLSKIEWDKRAFEVEDYIQRVLLSQVGIIKRVDLDDGDRDSKGPDADIYFVEGFPADDSPISDLKGEFKSSPSTVEAYKQVLRDDYFEEQIRKTMIGPWTTEAMKAEMKKKSQQWNQKKDAEKEVIISRLLTEKRIILINGGVGKSGNEKTPEKILFRSFYPQLFRIIETGREGESDELIYGRFYPQIAAIKQKVLEMQMHQNVIQLFPEVA